MPSLNRRNFLQVLGAAGLAPYLPGIPVQAAVTSGSASTSKALWASLYANSKSMSDFVGVAKNMGLSNTAIQGVGARSIGVRMALAASTETMAGKSAKLLQDTASPGTSPMDASDRFEQILENYFLEEEEEQVALVNEEPANNDGESPEENSS